MSSQSPSSPTTVNSILPMLLMQEGENNEVLLMFMMMNQQQCLPMPAPVVEEETDTIYRTWKVHEDGTRTLVSESADDFQ